MIGLVLVLVVGGVALAWALDREAKANARRASLARFAASAEFAELRRRFELLAEDLGRQLIPPLQRMAAALNEIDWPRIRRALEDDDTTSTGAPR